MRVFCWKGNDDARGARGHRGKLLPERRGLRLMVTFLFTDIEGSTRLWERVPKAMETALARHDAILRAAIEAEGGRVFKTMGDAFCAAFPTAAAALAAGVRVQHWLRAATWEPETGALKVRM